MDEEEVVVELCWRVDVEVEEVTGREEDLVDDDVEEDLPVDVEEALVDVELVVVVVVFPPIPKMLRMMLRFSTAVVLGCSVDAALAEAPVMLAVAAVVTSADIEAARDAVSTLKTEVEATAITGAPVAVGDGALRMASKSNC